jgi:imidazolonepropionase-like amidohydrolase
MVVTDTRADEKAKPTPPMRPWVSPVEAPDPEIWVGTTPVLIRGATVMTAAGAVHERGHVLLADGRIASVGPGPGDAPPDARVIDAAGKYVTPGLIDPHSHIGVFPMPGVAAHRDGNEWTAASTPGVQAEHAFWPQDPGIWRALSGGITTIQVLPGSANLIGGRSFVAKLKPAESARDMRFPGAPRGLKMACGENPKLTHGGKGRAPSSRMGNIAGTRAEFQRALEYRRKWKKYERDLAFWESRRGKRKEPADPPDPPPRDLGLETLVEVLDGKILVQMHCYRADELTLMMDVAREFGFRIRAFHHALEAYKVRHRLAAEEVASVTFVDWWGYKMEAFDGVPQNLALLAQAGARGTLHSDSAIEIRHLNQEAAKAMTAGRRLGVRVSEDDALRWVTAHPAWVLGVDDRVGTIEAGKMADVVLWDGHPFSVYTKANKVFIDGELVFDREAATWPVSDFELGVNRPGSWRKKGGRR